MAPRKIPLHWNLNIIQTRQQTVVDGSAINLFQFHSSNLLKCTVQWQTLTVLSLEVKPHTAPGKTTAQHKDASVTLPRSIMQNNITPLENNGQDLDRMVSRPVKPTNSTQLYQTFN